jgi:NAD(P)-dependent dehydrogenase (short-subunit alcohol dehydrogenase family)
MSAAAHQEGARPTALQVVEGTDLTATTVVITGATSGLGRQSALALAGAGAHVVLAARRDDALTTARDWIVTGFPSARVSLVNLDLTSLASVRAAAAAIAEITPAVDVLMNNAGVMFTEFALTTDGFELQLGTNHLGHFALTRLLEPQLRAAANEARIVVLSSDAHHLSDIDLDDPNWRERQYDKFAAYGAAKTANILHAIELDRRLADNGIRAYAVHPGMVATNLARYMSHDDIATITQRSSPSNFDVLTPEQGAATQVWAAIAPELSENGGVYLTECRISEGVAPYATDPRRSQALWEISDELTSG